MTRFSVPMPGAAGHDDPVFSFAAPSVAILDRQPVDAVLAEARRRSEKTELMPVNRLSITDDGVLDNGMAFTEDGFARFARVLKIPKKFVETCARTGARSTIMDAVRHTMRVADDDIYLSAMDAVVEGAGSDEYERISNIDAASMLLDAARAKAGGLGELRVARAAFSGIRMHLSVTAEAPSELQIPGDAIRAGVEMTNGDDGSALTELEGFLFRLVCSNGAIAKVHHGEEGRTRSSARELSDNVDAAVDSSIRLLRKVLPAVQVPLNRTASHDLFLKGAEKFGKSFAEDVSRMSEGEAAKWKRETPTAYDWWNAVTDRAKQATSFTRRRAIETYSADVLDWADGRYRKALAKVAADSTN